MSQRLNNDDRDRLIRVVLKHKFAPEEIHLFERFADLAAKVRKERLGAHRLRTMSKVPRDYLPSRQSFKVSFGGQQVELHLNGEPPMDYSTRRSLFSLGELKKVTDIFPDNLMQNPFAFFDGQHPLTNEFNRLYSDFEKHLEAVNDARAEVKSVVYSCSTTEKLMTVWPQSEPFVKSLGLAAPKSNLPAVQIEALNAKLGLGEAA